MTLTKGERSAEAAKALEGRLRAEGRHMEADTIYRLRMSYVGSRSANRQLHADNLALRAALKGGAA